MKKVIAFGIVFTPMLLLAAGPISDVGSAFTALQSWMRTLTTVIFAAAVLYFLWNVFLFIKSAGDEATRAKAREGIIWGIVGLTVMASIYGLISFLGSSTVGIGGNTISAPALPF